MAELLDDVLQEIDAGAFDPSKVNGAADPLLNDAMNATAAESQRPINLAVVQSKTAKPDQYQEHSALAKTFGLPVDLVGRNYDALKEKAHADVVTSILQNNAKLAEWYARGDNPAAIKVDELRHLSGLSWLGSAAADAFQTGSSNTEFGTLASKVMQGKATPEEKARADKLYAEQKPRSYGADSLLERAWVGGIEQIPMLFGGAAQSFKGFTIAAAGGAGAAVVAGQLGPQVATPEEIVTVPGMALAAGAAGGTAAMYLYSVEQIAGPAYYEFKSLKDANGVPMDDDVAKVAALVAGTAGGLLETIGQAKLLSVIPGGEKLTGLFTKDAIKRALTVPTVAAAFKSFAVNTLETGAVEISTEVGQQALQMFAGEMAKVYENAGAGGDDFAYLSSGEIGQQLVDTAKQTAEAMTLLGPALGGSRLYSDIHRANKASREQAVIGALMDHAKGNELNARLPEKAKEAVRAMTEGGKIQHVYVPSNAISEFFQTADETAAFVDAVGLADEYAEASATGRDMEIPIEVFYSQIAGSEIGDTLRPFVRLSLDAMNAGDAQAFNASWAEAQRSLSADYRAEIDAAKPALEGEAAVFDDVKSKAMDAGITPDQASKYARLYSTFFRVMADKTGVDAQEMYSRYGLDIKRVLPQETEFKPVDNLDLSLELVRAGKIDEMRKRVKKASGPSLVDAIIARGGVVDAGGELKAMDAPKRLFKKAKAGDETGELLGDVPIDLGSFDENSLDDMARAMWDAGYFPGMKERPTVNDLLDAIGAELGGTQIFSVQNLSEISDALKRVSAMVAFADYLDQLGLDPNAMSNDEIRAEIERITNDDAEAGALFQQDATQSTVIKPGVKRGSIQLSPGRTIINLFDAADLSTFLHESGHFFLEVFRDIASVENAPPEIVKDWETVTKFLGIEDAKNIPVEAHEKWARSFETYLFEGKAPSNELAAMFARFRSWLTFVYKSIKALNAPINHEIRNVMDRLLASDKEIADLQTTPEFRTQFKTAADAGMTEKQFEGYRETAALAVEEARRTLDAKLMAEIAREQTAEWREAKAAIKAEVISEFAKRPVYAVMDYLRTGKADFLPEGTPRLYMDKAGIVDLMGEGALLRLPKSVPPLYRAKGGVHPDMIAELFQFKTGEEMLTKMMSAAPMGRAVVDEVALRMRQRFGDLMGDGVARAREAEASISNDATGALLDAELKVLVKKGLVTTQFNKRDAKRMASVMIRGKVIREAVLHKLYMNANTKAAMDAEKAVRAKNWKGAIAAKQRQMFNHYAAMEAVQVEKETASAIEYLNKFTGRKRAKGVAPEYLDQIEKLLERFDFRKSISLTAAQKRLSLQDWIAAQEAMGAVVQIPDVVRDDAFRKPYKTMTVDDLLTVRDAVKNIEHLGRLKDKLLAAKKQREFEGVRDELVASVAASQELRPAVKTQNPTKFDEFMSDAKSLEASMLKLENVFSWMDGGDIHGPLRRFVWQPIADAEVAENELQLKYAGKFVGILDKLDKRRLNESVSVQGTAVPLTRSEVLAVALNSGNEQNLDKMIRAGHHGTVWTQEVVDALTSHLNEAEWKAVQEIWDMVNEFWPQIAALQKRLTGVEPPKVEAREVETPFGKLSGGYYPLIYDPLQSADAADRGAASADKLFENQYLRPETRHGFTKERAAAYTRPLQLDLDGAGRHIIGVIHDLTHREAILDAHKLLTNSVTRAEIEARYGREIYGQIVPWLQSIAHDAYKNDGAQAAEKLMRGIRSRATIMGMGFRITTMVTQLAGFSSSIEMVPVKFMAGAIKDFTRAPFAMNEKVNKLSGEMRFRAQNMDRDIREGLREITGKTGILNAARKFAFTGIGIMDRMVTVPSWMAAYNQHLASMPTDKEGAIAYADRVIRLTQGSGGAKDLAAITRKNELTKLLTMFYSYFSAYYNRQRQWGRDAKRAIEAGEYADLPDLLARQVFMTIGPAILSRLLVGDGPDDDESYAAWMAKRIALYPTSAVPIIRDAFGVFDKGFSYQMTPAARAVDETLVQPFKLLGDVMDGEAEPRQFVKQTIETTGYALKLPLGQVATTVDSVWKAIEKDDFQLRDLMISRQHK